MTLARWLGAHRGALLAWCRAGTAPLLDRILGALAQCHDRPDYRLERTMIRLATPADSAFVSAVGVAAGMFPADDTSVTDTMMESYFAGASEHGHLCVIDELENTAERVAMAYVEPVRATEGTCELLMIAVDPRYQGNGRGAALLRHVETWLVERRQRLLLVQTSGEDDYARTRSFYTKCGYEQAARVPDYYADAVDMVMFRRSLETSAGR